MCGRPSVGKLEQSRCNAGWCGHVSDLLVRLIAPLAIMPFARFGSRSQTRTRGAWVFVGFPDPAVQPACCISSYPPFPTSSGAVARPVFCYTICGSRYRSPLAIIAQIMRAFLLASATAATLAFRLASSCTSQGRLAPFRSA